MLVRHAIVNPVQAVRLAGGCELALLVGLALLARIFVLAVLADAGPARQAEIEADPAEVGVFAMNTFVSAALGALGLALAVRAQAFAAREALAPADLAILAVVRHPVYAGFFEHCCAPGARSLSGD